MQLNCSQLHQLGKYLFNSVYRIFPVGDFKRVYQSFYTFFLRPDRSDKPFNGRVYNTFLDFQTPDTWKLIELEMKPTDLVIVAEDRPIAREWRLIVACIDGKYEVITGSLYKENKQAITPKQGYPEGVKQLATEIANAGYKPAPIYMIDICETVCGSYKLLEINPFNTSDLYASDLKLIVNCVTKLIF